MQCESARKLGLDRCPSCGCPFVSPEQRRIEAKVRELFPDGEAIADAAFTELLDEVKDKDDFPKSNIDPNQSD